MLLNEVYSLPPKTWTPDENPVYATLTVVGDPKPDQYGFKQPVQVKDPSGISAQITIQSQYESGLMTQQMVNKKARWRLKWYAGRGGNKIVGYCLDNLTPQLLPQTPLQPTSRYKQQAQQLQDDIEGKPDWDAIARGKVRNSVVCAFISNGVQPEIDEVEYWVEYIMSGRAPLPAGKTIPDDSEPPWENT